MQKASWKRKLVYFFSDSIIHAMNLRSPHKFQAMLLDRMKPRGRVKTSYGEILFSCPNELIWWRISSFHEKEPETLKWIDGMEKESVFFDVGANIGVYSLYAARKGLRVFAFEPEAMNYSELTRNVFLNKFANLRPVNFAISAVEGFITFKTSSESAGTALQESELTNKDHKSFECTQTTFGTSIDKLVSDHNFPVPNYVKVDVDGPELDVIQGMEKTLRNKSLKSVLIEIDDKLEISAEIKKIMKEAGFEITFKTNFNYNINNYIFTRS